jgi:septal ring factor EnvC (AmiA/AmiB activator)
MGGIQRKVSCWTAFHRRSARRAGLSSWLCADCSRADKQVKEDLKRLADVEAARKAKEDAAREARERAEAEAQDRAKAMADALKALEEEQAALEAAIPHPFELLQDPTKIVPRPLSQAQAASRAPQEAPPRARSVIDLCSDDEDEEELPHKVPASKSTHTSPRMTSLNKFKPIEQVEDVEMTGRLVMSLHWFLNV